MKRKLLYVLPMVIILSACNTGGENLAYPVSMMIENANYYIETESQYVNNDLKGKYHLTAPIGWINDPNGFSYFNNEYHMFYQYNPYDAVHGPMHWGHQTTKDFITWTHQDVALAPDTDYDYGGCFSGTAIEHDGKLYLAYTSVTDSNQLQSIAYSQDGVTFKKSENNPAISSQDVPMELSDTAFRDPKIFRRNNKFYMLIGNENKDRSNKHVVLYESENIESGWKYVGNIWSNNQVGGIFECPELVTFPNGMDAIIACPQSFKNDNKYELQNVDSPIYMVGNLSTNTYKFLKSPGSKNYEEFDKGFSFYAPQVVKTSDDRRVLMAWMNQWNEPNVTRADGWAGLMSMPRELEIKDNHIYQKPVREISNYFTSYADIDTFNFVNGSNVINNFNENSYRLSLEIDVSNASGLNGVEIFKGSNNHTSIVYDKNEGVLIFDRNNSGTPFGGVRYAKVDPIDNIIKLDIFVDVCSIEVFINDGYYTMSGNVFPNASDNGLAFVSNNGKFSNVTYSVFNN